MNFAKAIARWSICGVLALLLAYGMFPVAQAPHDALRVYWCFAMWAVTSHFLLLMALDTWLHRRIAGSKKATFLRRMGRMTRWLLKPNPKESR